MTEVIRRIRLEVPTTFANLDGSMIDWMPADQRSRDAYLLAELQHPR